MSAHLQDHARSLLLLTSVAVSLSKSVLTETSFCICPCHESKPSASAMLQYLPRHVRQSSSAVSVQHSTCHAAPGPSQFDEAAHFRSLLLSHVENAPGGSIEPFLSCMTAQFLHTGQLVSCPGTAWTSPNPQTSLRDVRMPQALRGQSRASIFAALELPSRHQEMCHCYL